MIGVSSSSRDFAGLASYLVTGRSGEETERVAWTAVRNLPTDDPALVASIMRATASQNSRVQQAAYHLAISFDPTDVVDRATMERVAERVIDALGLREHQVLMIAHRDRDHPHLHLLVNRVHPETGRAWSRWQDQRVIQTVLRREELALGLRSVPGRLAPVPQAELALDAALGESGPIPGRSADEPAYLMRGPMAKLIADLRRYEEVLQLARARYEAQEAAAAARARLSELDAVVARARAAELARDRALAMMYRDPAAARRALHAALETHGLAATLRLLQEHPERLGALRTVEERRLMGLVRREADGPARSAAPYVAGKAREAVEAERLVWAVASEGHRRRAEERFTAELRALYREPDRARAAFDRLLRTEGQAHALATIRDRPTALGTLVTGMDATDAAARVRARALGAAAEVLVGAGVAAQADATRVRTADLAGRLSTILDAARNDVQLAADRERELDHRRQALPTQEALERRIGRALSRLLPRELTALPAALTAPQLAILRRIRTVIRDAVLQRDEERA